MQRRRWAATLAEEHATMVSVSALLKPKASYYNVSVSIGKDGERGCIQCKGCTWEAMVRKQAYHGGCGGGGGADRTKTLTR
jgi:hypothetical protein